MVTFREKAKIANPLNGCYSMELEMVVDSGATYTQIPSSLLSRLNIERRYKQFGLAIDPVNKILVPVPELMLIQKIYRQLK